MKYIKKIVSLVLSFLTATILIAPISKADGNDENLTDPLISDKVKKYEVSKYSSELKERKIKGEVADSWYRVTIVKTYNDEKEPENAFIEEDE